MHDPMDIPAEEDEENAFVTPIGDLHDDREELQELNGEIDYSSQLVDAPRMKKPLIKINSAKRTVRVDVKKLKDDMWHQIDENKVNTLKNIIDTGDKNIDSSFYFICLLHLANEHGLTMTHTDSDIQIS